MIQTFKQNIQSLFPNLTNKIDFQSTFRGAIVCTFLLPHYCLKFNQKNRDSVEEWGSKTDPKSPFELATFIRKNTSIQYTYHPDTPIYIWNSDQMKSKKIVFSDLHCESKKYNDICNKIKHIKI